MAITVGIPRETYPGERRVAIIPRACDALKKLGLEVVVERSAGAAAGYQDQQYSGRGANISNRADLFLAADIILQVRTVGANPEQGRSDLPLLKPGQVVVGFGEPLTALEQWPDVASTGASLFAMELMPRITRAQGMDALSSASTISGYKAVLLAASELSKMFPMLMTAAGTITPAKVFVLGAGVAGLQAIAYARKLGAVVCAYDVRPVVKEQVESVGAKFVTLGVESEAAQDKGGYAKALGEEFYRRQRELMTEVLREQDVVITTAAVPGRKAPILITSEMVGAMSEGAVIVDIAAERGGNCELTRPGETVVHNGVRILGPVNLASTVPRDASQMYGSNITAFSKLLVRNGAVTIDLNDEIVRETLITHEGRVVHARVSELIAQSGAQLPPSKVSL